MLANYSVQNLLSSSLLPKNLKIKAYRTIILPIVIYGCETWSLTLREERSLRVSGNRVLRSVFGPKSDSFLNQIPHQKEPEISVDVFRPT